MKRLIILVTVMLVLTSGLGVVAAPRIIAEVDIVTDQSAVIELKWSDGSTGTGIMVTSWRFTEERLVVYYRTGNDVPEGFSKRTVSHDTYTFPMKVHLERAVDHVPEFTDISNNDPGRSAILNLYYRGIIGGYPDGSFKPSNNVTRAEFSKMLLLTAEYTEDETAVSTFGDVSQDFWGRKYIMPLANRDILKGKGEGNFDPNGQIKVGEVLAVLTRTFELFEGDTRYTYALKDHWSNTAFLKAVEDGIVLPTDGFYRSYDAEVPATREQCSVLLSRILENLHDVTE